MDTLSKLKKNGIFLNQEDIEKICKKYKIEELAVFGSVIREDFNDKSDVDFLISFHKDSGLTLFHLIDLKEEFSVLLGREVDIVEKEGVTNPIRKKIIFESAEVVYAY